MSPINSTKEAPMTPALEVAQHPPDVSYRGLSPDQYQYTPMAYASGPEKGSQAGLAEGTTCGLRKVTFWLSLAIAGLVVIVVAIAVGLGVGLGLGKDGSPSSPATNATFSSTLSTASATSTSTSLSGTKPISCPDDNNTLKHMSDGSGIQYRIQCDTYFDKRRDLASIMMPSFADCLYLCDSMNRVQRRDDVSAVFFNDTVYGYTKGTCWCFGNATKTYKIKGIAVAIPQ
ncbi:hypothetical protein P170DRAFT_477297 [Aspergillus steynii IBT 23096]|uniref:Uncharacterized protein n=1 Tax=Aspergillus steynii IBT 23096 TaxID=1392250 RepID=A0A2I2G0L7_9EURO|nr:uncharacterized protein P170DRAFT_477297 [Aspergillus steynii IBT 23096]PLB46417.1 hypothetical protein P170DRAFT_477297 [Aspergillus steynii IBT 23096]